MQSVTPDRRAIEQRAAHLARCVSLQWAGLSCMKRLAGGLEGRSCLPDFIKQSIDFRALDLSPPRLGTVQAPGSSWDRGCARCLLLAGRPASVSGVLMPTVSHPMTLRQGRGWGRGCPTATLLRVRVSWGSVQRGGSNPVRGAGREAGPERPGCTFRRARASARWTPRARRENAQADVSGEAPSGHHHPR